MPVDLPARRVGDILLVYAIGASNDSSNAGQPAKPTGFEELYSLVTSTSYECYWAARVQNPDASLNLIGGSGQSVEAWATQAWVITNVTPATTWRDDFDTADNANNTIPGTFPALTVSGDDRLVAVLGRGFMHYDAPGSIVVPGEWDVYPDQSGNITFHYFNLRFRSLAADASVPSTEYNNEAASYDRTFGLAIIGVDDTPLPAQPQPGQVRLDCATSYTAWITASDYRTRVDVVGWTDIAWNRLLDEPSEAKVVVPDIKGGTACCIPTGGIKPWSYGLLIERNDIEVWSGPVTRIRRDPDAQSTTLQACDILKRYEKRFAVRNAPVTWLNTDSGVAFAGLINEHARSTSDPWFVECPVVFTGAGVTRTINPNELATAWSVMDELLGASVDAYVANGVLYVWEPNEGWRFFDGYKRTLDGPYNSNHDFTYGLFTAEAFTRLPTWDVDGMDMENFVAIPAADTGQLGFRQIHTAESAESQIIFGVLDHMEPNVLNLPEDSPPSEAAAVLQARANTVRDLHSMPPVVISGGVLAEGAPIDINGLRPGSIWLFDIFDACYGQLRVANRLKGIDVSVTLQNDGIVEAISPTLYPPGFEGGEPSG